MPVHTRVFGVPILAVLGASGTMQLSAQVAAGPRFEIAFARSVRAKPVTGMVYLAISRDNQTTPIQQVDTTDAALFSRYVDHLELDATIALTGADRGHPVVSINDIPAGDYWVQPFINVYTRFARADGHTVWLHMDQCEDAPAGSDLRGWRYR